MQEVLSVSNEVAAEPATVGDGVLDALRDRLRCSILLRGNRLTIEGSDPDVAQARAVIDELGELVEGGHEIDPSTVDAGARHGLRAGTMFPAFGMAEATLAVTFVVPGRGLEVDTVDRRVLETDSYAASVTNDDANVSFRSSV